MSEENTGRGFMINVTAGEDCRRSIDIEVAPDRFREEQEKVLREMAGSVAIPGFRKGKAPLETVRKRYADDIHSEAIRSILPEVYADAVSRENLQPIGDPVFRDVNVAADEPLRFTVDIEVEPAIEISAYRGLEVERREIAVEDEELQRVLESIRDRQADYEPVERGAGMTDVVLLDYVPIKDDGEPDEAKRVTGYPVQLGAGELFPAFEEAVVGTAPGETGRAEISYPPDFNPQHLAGKRVEYVFTVKEVREKRMPALDDKLAAGVDASFTSLEDLRRDVDRRLREEKRHEERRRREESAIDRLIGENPFEIPHTMIERYRAELYKEDERRRGIAGVGEETDEARRREIDDIFDQIARRGIKRFFIIDHIARLERVAVSDGEVEAEIDRIARESGKPRQEVAAFFSQDDRLRNIRGRIRERKVFDLILGEGENADG